MAVRSRRTFQILDIPGSGATATICVARDDRGRTVALKVLRESFVANADVLSRMRDEARMLHRLHHPSIVEVDGLLDLDGRPVLVMEYVEGLDLDAVVRRGGGPLPAEVGVEVARRVADALDAAWNHPDGAGGPPMHVVHRDVKPSNVMIAVDGTVKLTDFGTAKGAFEGREAESIYMVHGSQGFMAPERLDGVPDTPAVDVYGLAFTLFNVLAGKPMVVSRRQGRHDPAVTEHLPYLRPEGVQGPALASLRDLVARMARYEPGERPSPAEVREALGAWLDQAGLVPDLPAFAASVVAPLVRSRRPTPPERHPAWSDVRFLHDPPAAEEEESTILTPVPSEYRDTPAAARRGGSAAELEQLLRASLPRLAERLDELEEVLARRRDWPVAPLLDVIDRWHQPWWRVWRRPSSTAEVAAALTLLRHRSEPEVIARAERLAHAPSEAVARAARRLLARAGKETPLPVPRR